MDDDTENQNTAGDAMQAADEVETGTEASMDDEGDADEHDAALHANTDRPSDPASTGKTDPH